MKTKKNTQIYTSYMYVPGTCGNSAAVVRHCCRQPRCTSDPNKVQLYRTAYVSSCCCDVYLSTAVAHHSFVPFMLFHCAV